MPDSQLIKIYLLMFEAYQAGGKKQVVEPAGVSLWRR